jgi:hypothetical protein
MPSTCTSDSSLDQKSKTKARPPENTRRHTVRSTGILRMARFAGKTLQSYMLRRLVPESIFIQFVANELDKKASERMVSILSQILGPWNRSFSGSLPPQSKEYYVLESYHPEGAVYLIR